MKTNILVISGSNPNRKMGGTAVFVANLHPVLADLFNLKYLYLSFDNTYARMIPKRLLFFFYCIYTFIAKKASYNYVLSHTPEASFIWSFGKTPVIHIFHGNTNPLLASKYKYAKKFSFIYDLFERRIDSHCLKVLTVGDPIKGRTKISVPIQRREQVNSPKNNIVFIGRLEKVKNVQRVIDIYTLLPTATKKMNKLIIIGDGSEKKYLIEYVRAKESTEDVIFKGLLSNEETLNIIKLSAALLMASSYEGFPLAIAECLSLGTPVISTDVGSIRSIVKNGYNGYCLNITNPDTVYAETLVEVLDNLSYFSKNAYVSSEIFDPRQIVKIIFNDIQNFK